DRPMPAGQAGHDRPECPAVGEQRGDVLEHNARLRVVGNVADPGDDQLGQPGARGCSVACQGRYRRRFLPLGPPLAALVRRGGGRGPGGGPLRAEGWLAAAATGSPDAAASVSAASSAVWSVKSGSVSCGPAAARPASSGSPTALRPPPREATGLVAAAAL